MHLDFKNGLCEELQKKMKVAAHTIGTKVSECLQPKFVIGEKTHYNDFAHKFFQLSTYVFSTPKHEDIHMPCFATLRQAQNPCLYNKLKKE